MKKNLWKETSNVTKACIIGGASLLAVGGVCAIINARTNGAIEEAVSDAAEEVCERFEEATEEIASVVEDAAETIGDAVAEF